MKNLNQYCNKCQKYIKYMNDIEIEELNEWGSFVCSDCINEECFGKDKKWNRENSEFKEMEKWNRENYQVKIKIKMVCFDYEEVECSKCHRKVIDEWSIIDNKILCGECIEGLINGE